MDLGFVGNFNYLNKHYEENPYEIVYANDIYKNACKTYEHNFNFKPICSDINDIDMKSIP